MAEIARERLWAAARNFQYEGKVTEIYPYGNGHINDTFLLELQTEAGREKRILQRINKHVFP